MKLTIAYKGKEYDFDATERSTILDVKVAVEHATQLPPEALKVFFRGRPRADDDQLVLLGVKQFNKLVIVGNPSWTPPEAEPAPGEAKGGPKSKLDEILDSIKPLEVEAKAALSNGSSTATQRLRLQELLTQKMLELDLVDVQGEGRERRKKAIQTIEKICLDFENLG
ncbi:ubiquitin-like domain-containing protein [Chloropicon primus]|uniref:Uncharacterized protein n=1 Tax=Chloropicon primus TaxID=1764295 RepID=A0A5B8MWJ7_9CHLO|nr:hypothetical protein A3770_11p63480 [Chloropicon primus]UPR03043.1 ubiquitin-like domain-containing protein [Chloropicon primus]|eukprot:QDZ23830.1 hypothetical protein A3770_11p63480 [Chloropicon primus]